MSSSVVLLSLRDVTFFATYFSIGVILFQRVIYGNKSVFMIFKCRHFDGAFNFSCIFTFSFWVSAQFLETYFRI